MSAATRAYHSAGFATHEAGLRLLREFSGNHPAEESSCLASTRSAFHAPRRNARYLARPRNQRRVRMVRSTGRGRGIYPQMVDQVSFVIEMAAIDGGRAFPVVTIRINQRRLEDLAHEVEKPFAVAEGKPQLAGDYAGLSPSVVAPGSRHFLGEPVEVWFEDGDTVLLGCTCGEPGCWPLTARVHVTDTTITWDSFRNGHRPWDLSGLGPFEFDRGQYEEALDRAAQRP